MATKAMTGSDQKLFMFDEYAGADIASYPVEGGIHYIKAKSEGELEGLVVRDEVVNVTTSGLSVDVYTVADPTIFRIGERVPVLSGSGVRIGTVKVISRTATTIKVEKVSEKDFDLTSGDILVLEEDSYLPELGLDIIETSVEKFALVKGDSGVKLVQYKNDEGKKKNS